VRAVPSAKKRGCLKRKFLRQPHDVRSGGVLLLSYQQFKLQLRLGDVCDLYQPITISAKEFLDNGQYKVFGANSIIGYYDRYYHEDSEVLITCGGAICGTINYSEPKSWITGNAMVAKPKDERVNKNYLFYLLKNVDLSGAISGSAQP
jgi:restriction endonuclease S subunit